MKDPIEKLNADFLKQDVEFIKEEHENLMRSYISLTADVAALEDLVLKIAQKVGMDTKEMLAESQRIKDKTFKNLLTIIKNKNPKFYEDL